MLVYGRVAVFGKVAVQNVGLWMSCDTECRSMGELRYRMYVYGIVAVQNVGVWKCCDTECRCLEVLRYRM